MEGLTGVGIILLAAVIHATLQLGLGCLLLLYHASMGKHIRKKTRSLTGSFISGVGIIIFLGLFAACYGISNLTGGTMGADSLAAVTVILTGLALIVWICYYRRGQSTELWIPTKAAKFIDHRAKVTESDTEAFSLGILTCFVEVPFTLVLIILAANNILQIAPEWQMLMALIYTLIAILPLLILKGLIKTGRTVVDIQRWRVKNKNFLRAVSGAGFLVLAGFVLAFEVWGAM